MICYRCLHHLRLSQSPLTRLLSTTTHLSSGAPTSARGPPSHTHEGPPVPTSTSTAQPFSTPFSPTAPPLPTSASAPKRQIQSSVPAGTPLKGLGYLKGKDPPIAKEDDEYPDWLWGLLDEKAEGGQGKDEGGDGDLYAKSKKQRQKAARAARKAAAANPEALVPKIPLEHQSIDLPAGDGNLKGAMEAARAREEVKGAMRVRRRKGIKEANFLTGMR